MPISKFRPTFTFTQDRLEQLKSIVPEAFADGKINWESLKQALGEFLEDESQEAEHFGLFWPGKREARRLATLPSKYALVLTHGEGIDEDDTRNIFIEGENLEVLKLLQKSYAGRIKMIYIDPPYNTGNDFVYKDDESELIYDHLLRTNLIDENGNPATSNIGHKKNGDFVNVNTRRSARFHSNWLNMMYPRLLLAKNLLRDDGVIFVNIGDHEIHNLRAFMDEIFGEENYINTICTKAKPSAGASGGGEDKRLKKNVEFLLVYVKNRDAETALDLNQAFDETELMEHITAMREEEKSWKYTRVVTDFGRRSIVATTQDGEGNEIKVFRHTGFKLQPISELARNGETEADTYLRYFENVFRDTNAQSSIRTRVMEILNEEDGFFSIDYIPRSGRSKGKLTTVYYKGTKKDQIAWLRDIARKIGNEIYIRGKTGTLWADFNWNNVSKEGDMPFPNGKKPIALIQRMLQLSTRATESDIVLDFFAGSCSTAHAVLDMNKDDCGNRHYICVQLPESISTSERELNTVAEIGKERIRRVIAKMKKEANGNSQTKREIPEDLGFKVFKLTRSNFRAWEDYDGENPEKLEKLFDHAETPLVENWKEEDLLTEIILQQGFPLDSRITPQADFKQNKIQLIESTFCEHKLFICLDSKVKDDTVKHLQNSILQNINERKNDREKSDKEIIVCLDSALTDQAKMRLADACNLKVI